jgi:uncharacterized MAPEG superfamily protein
VQAPLPEFLDSEEAFEAFVKAWRDGVLPKPQWTHIAHIAVGAWFAVRYPEEAFEQVRAGILAYNHASGTANTATSGYHETLTRFWASVIGREVGGMESPWRAAVRAVETFAPQRDIYRRYYSFDVIRDPEARRIWVEPDLQAL